MRIALCAPVDLHELARYCGKDSGGIAAGLGGTATTPLIREYLRRGHEVTLYTLSNGLDQGRSYHWGNLRIRTGPFRERHLAATYYTREIGFLRRAIEADAPPFVHAHWTYEFALGALRSGTPTLTTIHDLPWNVLRHYRDPHRAIRLIMAYEVALRGKHFTAVSRAAALHFARHFRPGAKIELVANGLPDEVFDLGRGGRVSRSHAVTFATILQGWSHRKNAEAALRAFGSVRRQVPQARLVMYGEGYQPNGPAHRWATSHGLERDVVFSGSLPHADLLRQVAETVDIVVHPSRDEAFSMAALESLALQRPLIAGETTPGMREMLGPSGGVLVDVNNPSAIARTMVQLAANADYRRHLAHCNFERAFQHYRLSTVADRYEALYSEMLRPPIAQVVLQTPSMPHVPLDL